MTPANRHKLAAAERSYIERQYPSVPAHARPQSLYCDTTTNGLTKCIIDYIRYTGGYAERVQRMGFRIKAKSGKEIFVSGGGTNGTADISGVLPGGRSIRVEVKFGKDRIRPDQIRYAERVIRAGALYFIARTFDEFVQWYESVQSN